MPPLGPPGHVGHQVTLRLLIEGHVTDFDARMITQWRSSVAELSHRPPAAVYVVLESETLPRRGRRTSHVAEPAVWLTFDVDCGDDVVSTLYFAAALRNSATSNPSMFASLLGVRLARDSAQQTTILVDVHFASPSPPPLRPPPLRPPPLRPGPPPLRPPSRPPLSVTLAAAPNAPLLPNVIESMEAKPAHTSASATYTILLVASAMSAIIALAALCLMVTLGARSGALVPKRGRVEVRDTQLVDANKRLPPRPKPLQLLTPNSRRGDEDGAPPPDDGPKIRRSLSWSPGDTHKMAEATALQRTAHRNGNLTEPSNAAISKGLLSHPPELPGGYEGLLWPVDVTEVSEDAVCADFGIGPEGREAPVLMREPQPVDLSPKAARGLRGLAPRTLWPQSPQPQESSPPQPVPPTVQIEESAASTAIWEMERSAAVSAALMAELESAARHAGATPPDGLPPSSVVPHDDSPRRNIERIRRSPRLLSSSRPRVTADNSCGDDDAEQAGGGHRAGGHEADVGEHDVDSALGLWI